MMNVYYACIYILFDCVLQVCMCIVWVYVLFVCKCIVCVHMYHLYVCMYVYMLCIHVHMFSCTCAGTIFRAPNILSDEESFACKI